MEGDGLGRREWGRRGEGEEFGGKESSGEGKGFGKKGELVAEVMERDWGEGRGEREVGKEEDELGGGKKGERKEI